MADTSVKLFRSINAGAPTISGTAGSLIPVLDACLVNGFGQVTLDTLIIVDNVATGTVNAGHGFTMTGNAGTVILVEGATPTELNGEWRIASVNSAQIFTFITSGIADQTATGTITAKRAPAGFSKVFSGTNKAVYRSNNPLGNRLYLRVDDSTTTYASLIMYETMSSVDAGTGPAPISGSLYTGKSSAASAAARQWTIIADSQLFYLLVDSENSGGFAGVCHFGDISSYKPGDAYAVSLRASSTAIHYYLYYLFSEFGYLARGYASTGGAIAATALSHGRSTNLGGNTQVYPALTNGEFQAWPVELWEASNVIARGILPGLWNPIHKTGSGGITHGLIIDDVPQLNGGTLFCHVIYSASTGSAAFDISGPWR